MGLISEFKEFAVKGNAIDMAVGIILGGAFGKVVTSVVQDLIMPPIGALGEADFSSYYLPLTEAANKFVTDAGTTPSLDAMKKANQPALAYGNFITILINFLIVAFAVFLLVKAMNAVRREDEEPEAPAAPPADIALLTEIRDLLGKKG